MRILRKDMRKAKPRDSEESPILYKRSFGEKVLFAIVFLIFMLYAVSLIYPLFWLVINSFQDSMAYELNKLRGDIMRLPEQLGIFNYVKALKELNYNDSNILQMFFNSIWFTVLTVGENVFCCTCTGYALSKYKFGAKNVIYGVIIFTMTVPIVGTTGALFKLVNDMGIYNTPLYVVLHSLSGTGLGFMVMYAFFKNVSWSYAESAFVDGAGHGTVFFKIMLPQALPAMGALVIVQSIGVWNNYMDVLLYLPDYPTLASGMYGVSRTLPRLGQAPVYFAALVLSMIPVLIMFICFSDKIMKNFTVGGLKG